MPLVSDLKQLRKLNFCENLDFHKHFTFIILSERPCITKDLPGLFAEKCLYYKRPTWPFCRKNVYITKDLPGLFADFFFNIKDLPGLSKGVETQLKESWTSLHTWQPNSRPQRWNKSHFKC